MEPNGRNKWIDVVALITFLCLFIGVSISVVVEKKLPIDWTTIGIIVAAFLTFATYSFLYKDNPLFKIAEHLFVGVGLGVSVVLIWFNFIKQELYKPLIRHALCDVKGESPDYWVIIPFILGLFMFARFWKKTTWISRYSFAFVVGGAAGIGIPVAINSFILKQLEPSMQSIFIDGAIDWGTINVLLMLLGTTSVLIYFFFSTEHKGVIGKFSRVGIFYLMISFGAMFGYTVMGRMSLLIQRIQFLVEKWLQQPLT